jgi:hypothetical protein
LYIVKKVFEVIYHHRGLGYIGGRQKNFPPQGTQRKRGKKTTSFLPSPLFLCALCVLCGSKISPVFSGEANYFKDC